MRIFDIRTNGNILKMLMCCIINIQPNGFPDFPSATLYYMNFFVNFQTNNTKYFQMCMEIKTQNTKNLRTTQGCKMSSPAKGGSQPCGWQIASSRNSFCDFGRKLVNLRLPVRNTVLCCHGRQHKS